MELLMRNISLDFYTQLKSKMEALVSILQKLNTGYLRLLRRVIVELTTFCAKDEVSMLNFEHSAGRPGQFKGTAAILQKLQSLPQQVKHQVITIDCQPTPGGGVLVMICGNLLVDTEIPQKFSQVFQLLPTGSGSYYIFNDIFRLNIG